MKQRYKTYLLINKKNCKYFFLIFASETKSALTNFIKNNYLICLICLIIIIPKFFIPLNNVLSWDVFGYYLYLPAKFIYHDLGITDMSWLNQLLEKYQPTATLYQLVDVGNGEWLIKYTAGLAFLYSPFFFIAHFTAEWLGFPADGLSLPYQYAITVNGLIYTIIGLWLFNKSLNLIFEKKIASLILILIVFGTNFYQLAAFGGTLLTHNYIFTFYAILLFCTIQWHNTAKIKFAVWIGISLGFIVLVRPSEFVAGLIPLLWNAAIKEKYIFIKKHLSHVLIILFTSFVILLPQLFYWKSMTGSWLFFSYKNPGEGFDFLNPHTLDFLFSFRKGWFIYTPLMLFSFVGMIILFRKNRSLFWLILIFIIADIYLVSSWTCWWYAGGSYSARSMQPAYVLMAIPLGYMINEVKNKFHVLKYFIYIALSFIILLNLVQTFQYQTGIISKERMSKEYYFKTFGKISYNANNETLLLVQRLFDGPEILSNEEDYQKSEFYTNRFEELQYGILKLDSLNPYSPGPDVKYSDITITDHAWFRVSVKIYIPEEYKEELPMLTATFHHRGEAYKYSTFSPDPKKIKYNDWNEFTMDYLTPEVRSSEDNLKVYIWHRGKSVIYADDFVIYKYIRLKD